MCGIDVISRIKIILSPASCNPRIAVSLPAPGPFTNTFACFIPWSSDDFAAISAAVFAANGVDFRAPLKPQAPAEDQEITSPFKLVIVIIVLLKLACIWTIPFGTFFRIFFGSDF